MKRLTSSPPHSDFLLEPQLLAELTCKVEGMFMWSMVPRLLEQRADEPI